MVKTSVFEQAKVMALIGSSGVGKTSALLKLAKFYASQHKRVAVMTLEEECFKGKLLKIFLNQIEGTFFLESIEQIMDYDVVLIDTPGVNCLINENIERIGLVLSENS